MPYFSFENIISGLISSSKVTKIRCRSSKRVHFSKKWPFFIENKRENWWNTRKMIDFDPQLGLKSKIRISFRFEPNYGKMSGFPIILNRLRRHLIKWSLNLNYDRLNWNRLFQSRDCHSEVRIKGITVRVQTH